MRSEIGLKRAARTDRDLEALKWELKEIADRGERSWKCDRDVWQRRLVRLSHALRRPERDEEPVGIGYPTPRYRMLPLDAEAKPVSAALPDQAVAQLEAAADERLGARCVAKDHSCARHSDARRAQSEAPGTRTRIGDRTERVEEEVGRSDFIDNLARQETRHVDHVLVHVIRLAQPAGRKRARHRRREHRIRVARVPCEKRVFRSHTRINAHTEEVADRRGAKDAAQ